MSALHSHPFWSRLLRRIIPRPLPPPTRPSCLSTMPSITLFLCGDVMTGRGIDQVLPYSCDPQIYEPAMNSAKGYVEIAEIATGQMQKPVDFAYIWGDAMEELQRVKPDARIINLETSVTTSTAWEPKGINYRMHPKNVPCLTAAKIDCCVLANNHILDWGCTGLEETLETLGNAGIRTAGVGLDSSQAQAPAVIDIPGKGRVLIFSFGFVSSGVPKKWAAAEGKTGVNFVPDLSCASISKVSKMVASVKKPSGDIVVASLHWGGNWGYEIEDEESNFAHLLIDQAGVDVVHGHSSHHVKGIEVYQGKLILYGCGDFLNDYEGIRGYESYRDDLTLMYFPSLSSDTGKVESLLLTPMQIRHFKLNRTTRKDAEWLLCILNREGRILGTHFRLEDDNRITLEST
eukprot:c26610_g1_i1 orf=81-1289(+)